MTSGQKDSSGGGMSIAASSFLEKLGEIGRRSRRKSLLSLIEKDDRKLEDLLEKEEEEEEEKNGDDDDDDDDDDEIIVNGNDQIPMMIFSDNDSSSSALEKGLLTKSNDNNNDCEDDCDGFRDYIPYVTPSIIREKKWQRLADQQARKFDVNESRLINQVSNRMMVKYRETMEDLQYSFYKSFYPLKMRVRELIKYVYFLYIMMIVALILLSCAYFTIKWMENNNNRDETTTTTTTHHVETHGRHNETANNNKSWPSDLGRMTVSELKKNRSQSSIPSCTYVTSYLPGCGKAWKPISTNKNNTIIKNITKKLAEKVIQDTWKMHVCNLPCLNCDRLMQACVRYNAKGACLLWDERCKEGSNTPHNISAPLMFAIVIES
eukprot:Seg3769.5 transcript_id=Seg3769.5/GoldUCD/mRNA.D3Y31 product="hypothetical protein" protein_id=Seg3769.5/GoldUCD/D3Y31